MSYHLNTARIRGLRGQGWYHSRCDWRVYWQPADWTCAPKKIVKHESIVITYFSTHLTISHHFLVPRKPERRLIRTLVTRPQASTRPTNTMLDSRLRTAQRRVPIRPVPRLHMQRRHSRRTRMPLILAATSSNYAIFFSLSVWCSLLRAQVEGSHISARECYSLGHCWTFCTFSELVYTVSLNQYSSRLSNHITALSFLYALSIYLLEDANLLFTLRSTAFFWYSSVTFYFQMLLIYTRTCTMCNTCLWTVTELLRTSICWTYRVYCKWSQQNDRSNLVVLPKI